MAPELAQILQGGGGAALPQGPDSGGYGQTPQGGIDPLTALQEVIQLLPTLMAALPDPRDTQDVARCLLVLTGIQTRMMQGPGGGGGGGAQGGYGGQPAAA